MIIAIVGIAGGCARREPPPLETLFFEHGFALHPILESSDPPDPQGGRHFVRATMLEAKLAHRLPDASSQVEKTGLDLRCEIADGSLTVTATSTLVVTERTDVIGRCSVSGLEVPVWVTIEPPPEG